MTKAGIVKELRRSAMEDFEPWYGVRLSALERAHEYYGEDFCGQDEMQSKMFFLLVACALEDE